MVVREATAPIVNSLGLHARPAAEFVKTSARFKSSVVVKKDALEVNGKSIMGMMMLAAEQGRALVIRVEGEDADHANAAQLALVRSGCGEEGHRAAG